MSILKTLKSRLITSGLDLINPFPSSLLATSTRWNSTNPQLAVLISNSRALWSPFIKHLKTNPDASQSTDPLDNYIETSVRRAVLGLEGFKDVFLPSETGDRFVDFQRVASASGFGYLNQAAGLIVHPTYGPWVSLRALLLFDAPFPVDLAVPRPLENPGPEADDEIAEVMASFLGSSPTEKDYAPLIRIRDLAAGFLTPEQQRSARFGEAQMGYHYSKEKRWLETALPEDTRD